jgi:hypothetical protein
MATQGVLMNTGTFQLFLVCSQMNALEKLIIMIDVLNGLPVESVRKILCSWGRSVRLHAQTVVFLRRSFEVALLSLLPLLATRAFKEHVTLS